MNKTMIISAVIAAAVLAGCSLSGAAGNRSSDIKASIKTLSERYGVEFKLKKKKFAGGASVNVYATCPETGDRQVYVFQFNAESRVTAESAVKSDYIYVRYGAAALSAIRDSAEKACPGCKVIVNERVYNHLTSDKYGKDTDLAVYLRDNEFDVDVLMPRMLGKTELEAFYRSLEEFMHDDGIYCKELMLGCPEDFDSVVPPDHIICTNEDQYAGSNAARYTYSAYCPNYITKNNDPFDSSSPYYVVIDDHRVK